jgi:16S rRNA (uracil1498-N3)-methyltransferase
MTAAFFLVESFAEPPAPGSVVTVSGDEGRHAVTVRRLGAGEPVLVGDGAGRVVTGSVAGAVGKDVLEVRVESFHEHPVPAPRVVVVQALAKGERGELSVELLTEVGVDEVVPWSASRSVARWVGDKVDRGLAKWRATAREAAKQSRRPYVPVVAPLAVTAEVAELIRATVAGGGTALVLHEAAGLRLASMRLRPDGDVLLVVGPEGGISDEERAAFEEAGALSARLGPSVLRTSTAGTVAAAVVLASCGRWD